MKELEQQLDEFNKRLEEEEKLQHGVRRSCVDAKPIEGLSRGSPDGNH